MKLLSKNEVRSYQQKEAEILTEKTSRLASFFSTGLKKLNTIKDSYEPDKIRKQKIYDDFVQNLALRKSQLLKDYALWEKRIEEKKDLYYALVEKADELSVREENIKDHESRLDLREKFNLESEARLKILSDKLTT